MMKWFSKAVILILWVFALPIFAQEIPTQTVDLGDDYVLTVPQSWAVKRIQDGAFTVSGGSLTITVTTPTLLQKLNIRFDSSTPIIDVLASLALPFNGVQVVPADVALSTTEGRESASYTNTTNATVDQRYAVVMLGDGTFGYITITGVKGGLDKQEDAINAMIASFKNATAPVPTATPTVPSPTPSDTPTDTATPVPTDTPTPQPTDTATPVPTDTPVPPTNTLVPPTDTPVPPTNTLVPPTDTPVPPTSTPVPTDTLVPPTDTPVPPTNTVAPAITSVPPTDTPVPPTSTPVPTDTLVPPTDTPVPTDTQVPPTSTPVPTDTPIPPTNTPVPTDTPVPPTDTPVPPTSTLVPTDTPVPPTNTPVPPTATDTATPLPTNTATPLPTATPTVPTATPSDTATPEPCMVSIDRKNSATLRVGPGTNRGAISYLLPNSPTLVTGRAQLADGSVWYQLDKDQAAPSGTEAAELWVSADEIYTSGACDNIGVVATPPIIRRASATPEGGESTAEVTSEATSQPTDTPTSESTGTPTRTPSATVTQAAPTEAAPTATPEVVIAPPEGSIVPINGNWQLTFNAETNRSCQGGQNEVVQSADVFENPTFSARLRVIDRDKFSYGSDVYVRVPGTNTFTGQFTIEHNENAQVWLTLNSNVSIFGQVTNNYSDGSKPCSATALFLLERQ